MFTLSLSVLIQILHIIQISKVDINKKTTFNTFLLHQKSILPPPFFERIISSLSKC